MARFSHSSELARKRRARASIRARKVAKVGCRARGAVHVNVAPLGKTPVRRPHGLAFLYHGPVGDSGSFLASCRPAGRYPAVEQGRVR